MACLGVGQRVTQLAGGVRIFGLSRDLGNLESQASELVSNASGEAQVGGDAAASGVDDAGTSLRCLLLLPQTLFGVGPCFRAPLLDLAYVEAGPKRVPEFHSSLGDRAQGRHQ